MARHIEVEISPQDPALEPVTFTLRGLTRQGNPWSETFTVLPVLPATVLDGLLVAKRTDPRSGRTVIDQFSVTALLLGIVVTEDEDRLRALFDDKERLVPLEALAQILQALVEEVTGSPSTP